MSYCIILYYIACYCILVYSIVLYYIILYYIKVYHIILCYIILYYTILHYIILYFTILYFTILYFTILYYIISYYIILYHIILYKWTGLCIVSWWSWNSQFTQAERHRFFCEANLGKSIARLKLSKTGPAEALLNDIRLTFGKRAFGKRRLKIWPGVANRAQSQRNGCATLGTTTLSKLVSLASQMLWHGVWSIQSWSTTYFILFIWVNYNSSLTWIKAILGWFPLLTMIIVRSQWGRYNLPRFIPICSFGCAKVVVCFKIGSVIWTALISAVGCSSQSHPPEGKMGLSENSVPNDPMVLLIIIPFLNGYFIGNINPTFSDIPILHQLWSLQIRFTSSSLGAEEVRTLRAA